MIDLSIIIVSYNTKETTVSCIESVYKHTKSINFEVIVVDNFSNDGSLRALMKLAKNYSNLKVIGNQENLGFAGANNQGIGVAKGKYILLLNSDTLFENSFIKDMLVWMDKGEKIKIASCRLQNKDGSPQANGGYFPTLLRSFAWMTFLDDLPFIRSFIKPYHLSSSAISQNVLSGEPIQQDWVTGAFLLFNSTLVNKIGLLDGEYFMYVEDMDFCYRAKLAGAQVWYLPQWYIIHLGGRSSKPGYSLLMELKGLRRFYSKYYPKWQQPLFRVTLGLGILFRVLLFTLLLRFDYTKIYLKAFRVV